MSAFLCSQTHIQILATFLKAEEYFHLDMEREGLPRARDAEALGKWLYDTNCESLRQKYGDDGFEPYRHKHRPESFSDREVYDMLSCWSYQSCEGDVYESPFYRAIESAASRLARSIIRKLPDEPGERVSWEATEKDLKGRPVSLMSLTSRNSYVIHTTP